MSERISLIVPSRARPVELTEMIWTAFFTSADPDAFEVCVWVDDDDPVRADYDALAGEHPTSWPPVRLTVGPRPVMSAAWDLAAKTATGDIWMLAADDLRFRTPGWDSQVRAAFGEYPDRIVLVYGRDGINDEALATHPFVHRRWVETLGYFVPPVFSCDYADAWLFDIAGRIERRRFLPDVLIEHLHPSVGKAPYDRTHQERLARGERDRPGDLYDMTDPERERDAELLQAVMV